MIIIIEGPDGSGKTTLAKQLAERFNLDYHHEGPPPTDVSALEHYGSILESRRHTNIVFDRFALGERVYGPILRGYDRLGPEGYRVFSRLLRASCAIQILCLPKFETAHANWTSGRLELFKDEHQYAKSYEGFYNLRQDQWIYNYEQPDEFHRFAAHIARLDKEAVPLPSGYVGAPDGEYLFVGDQGSNPKAKVDLPFWGTSNSCEYLTNALDRAGYGEAEYAMVNARDLKGKPFKILRFPKIICLGVAASKVCTSQDLPYHASIPHPQFWKRFHSSDTAAYVERLAKVR